MEIRLAKEEDFDACNEKTLNFYKKHGFNLGGNYIECKKEL